ncbi:MAG: right-handed parallel beta-helix repeat-containing protein [Alphaproteobacteria bacterium]|nr:right-handed parallel beta-helix repeat-containing protein [Alphaproteobacteria bacterium]
MSKQHRSGDAARDAAAPAADEALAPAEAELGNSFLQEQLRARGEDVGGSFQLLGQSFGTLQAVHDWLMAEAERPGSTVPHEPELRVTAARGATIHQREQTDWSYYSPDQKLIIDGQGATVSGRSQGQPTPGWFLSYRPVVESSEAAPAKANFELRDLTVRGYESGGVELSPQSAAGEAHRYDGGLTAFIEGALIEDNRFEQLGSADTPYKKTDYKAGRFGAAGVLMRGVSGSEVRDNVFKELENDEVRGTPTGQRLIHAVYARDKSSNNRIEGNVFRDISGDPVRVSNASNHNTITGNRSRSAGLRTLVSEFYNSGPSRREADSVGNRVFGNDRGARYEGQKKVSRFYEKHVG